MKIIDIHTHGIGGYDTRTTDVDHLLKIAEIHGSYGVSEILLSIYSATIRVMRENMGIVKRGMEIQAAFVNWHNEPETQNPSSKIIGVHLEGPFLNPAKCGAMNAITFIEPAESRFQELIEGFESIVKIITIAPEMKGAVGLIKKISDMGITVSLGHSDATYDEAEAGFHAGAKGITHLFNAMRGFHHREPGIAGFGLLNRDIYIEIVADPYHLHEETLELVFKAKDHEKIIIISDTGKDSKTFMEERGDIDADGKLLGGSMTIPESAQMLIQKGYDRNVVMDCITKNPEKYIRRC
jgi:N-acetylglucosamine-6-phosphate deacetylase